MHGLIWGGGTLALVAVGMFATVSSVLGGELAGSVTLDQDRQFTGAGKIGGPRDGVGEIIKETGLS